MERGQTRCTHTKRCKARGLRVCHNPTCRDPILRCGRDEGCLCCSRCRFVNYCSAECQVKHWPVHKTVCFDRENMTLFQLFSIPASTCSMTKRLGCHAHPQSTLTDVQHSLLEQVYEQIELLPKDNAYALSCQCKIAVCDSKDALLVFDAIGSSGLIFAYATCRHTDTCPVLPKYKPLLTIRAVTNNVFSCIPYWDYRKKKPSVDFSGTFSFIGSSALKDVPAGYHGLSLLLISDNNNDCPCPFYHIEAIPCAKSDDGITMMSFDPKTDSWVHLSNVK